MAKVRKTSKPERLRHQPEILQHHALFDGDEFGHELFHLSDRCHATIVRVVVEMSAAASGEFPDAGGLKMISFIQQIQAGAFVEDFQQPVHVHEREIVYRQKITRARRVRGPAVHIDVEQRLDGSGDAPILNLHAAAFVEFDQFIAAAQFDQFRQRVRRKFSWAPDQVRRPVIRDDQRDGLQSITARDRASGKAGHDVPALALRIAQIGQRVTGDAARGEDQRGLLGFGERRGLVPAFVSKRTAGNFHSATETPRPPVAQRGQQRKSRQCLHFGKTFRFVGLHAFTE